MEEKNNWIERVFSSDKAWVEVESGDMVLNPFTTILLRFYDGEELVKEAETIFKCDALEGCEFCWTNDLSSVVLAIGRQRKTFRTEYKGLLLWNSSPILEERFYSKVKVYPSFLIAVKEHATFVKNFKDLLIEERQGLYRLLPDNELSAVLFTQDLEVRF